MGRHRHRDGRRHIQSIRTDDEVVFFTACGSCNVSSQSFEFRSRGVCNESPQGRDGGFANVQEITSSRCEGSEDRATDRSVVEVFVTQEDGHNDGYDTEESLARSAERGTTDFPEEGGREDVSTTAVNDYDMEVNRTTMEDDGIRADSNTESPYHLRSRSRHRPTEINQIEEYYEGEDTG